MLQQGRCTSPTEPCQTQLSNERSHSQGGALGCFSPDPVFGAVHGVSSGPPCFLGVSQALGHACVPAVPPPAPGWEQKAGVAAGRHRSRHLAWPWQLGSAVPRRASVSPAWHHRLQPAPNWGSAHMGVRWPLWWCSGGCSGVRMGVSPAIMLWGLLQFRMRCPLQ